MYDVSGIYLIFDVSRENQRLVFAMYEPRTDLIFAQVFRWTQRICVEFKTKQMKQKISLRCV